MDTFELNSRTSAALARYKTHVPASRDLTSGKTAVRDFSGASHFTLESTTTTTFQPHLFGKTHRVPTFRSGACHHAMCKGKSFCMRMSAGQKETLAAAVPPSSLRTAASIGLRGLAGVSKRGIGKSWTKREVKRRDVLPLEVPPIQSIHPLNDTFSSDLEKMFGGEFDPYGTHCIDEAEIAASFGK